MKILLVTFEYPPLPGGIATYCQLVARELVTRGHDVLVLAPCQPPREPSGAKIRYLFKSPRFPIFNPLLGFFTVLYHRWRFRPEKMLFNHIDGLRLASLISGLFPGMVAAVFHGTEQSIFQATRSGRLLLDRLLRNGNRIFTVSDYGRHGLLAKYPWAKDLVKVAHNGISRNLYDAPLSNSESLARSLGISGRPVILTMARLNEGKNQHGVLKALITVTKKYNDVVYLIAGTGPAEDTLRRLVPEYSLEQNVIFLGLIPCHEVVPYYDLCDIFALPSSFESLPFSLLEAGARGKAVVASPVGGVPEVIEDGQDGLLVETEDTRAISDALLRLLDNEELRNRIGQNLRTKVGEKFLADQMVAITVNELTGTKG